MDLANAPMQPVTAQDNSGLPAQPQGQAQPSQQDQFFGKMKFHVSNGQSEGYADEHQLVNDLRQVGYQPLGVSADGMTVTLQGDNGPYEVKTPDVLQKMGWQVKGYQPMDVDHEHVSPELRFIIESPGLKDDDHAKQAVITSRLQRMGIKEPQIVGSGSDWFVFNPGTSQYIALTNKPGFDMGDLGEIGARAPGLVGNAVGAVLGTPADIGTGPLGTVGGAVAGGFAGNRLADAGAAALEPSYMDAIRHRGLGENLKTVASEVGTDAVAGLGGYGLGKLGGAGAGLVRQGLASRMLQGGGRAAELGGKAVQGTADFLGQGLPRELGIGLADPTNVSLYADLARIPQSAVRGAARGIGSLGDTKLARSMVPDQAARLRDLSAKLLTRQTPAGSSTMGSKLAGALGRETVQPGTEIGAEEVLGNLGDHIGMKIGRARAAAEVAGREGVGRDAAMVEHQKLQELLRGGMRFDDAAKAARQHAMDFSNDWVEGLARDSAPDLPQFGAVGRGFDNAAKLGEMGINAAGVPYDIGIGAARAGGRALNQGGRAARSIGEGLAPLETPLELKAGSEELMNRLKRRQAALQQQGYDRNIVPDTTLAQNP